MRQSKLISEQVVTDVTQISRSVVLLYFLTEQVKQVRVLVFAKGAKADEATGSWSRFRRRRGADSKDPERRTGSIST